MKKIEIFLAHLSMLPMPASRVIQLAIETGYDGVELFSNLWTVDKFETYFDKANARGLLVHAHQAWSHEESNDPSLKSKILELIHYLPPTGMSPLSSLPPVIPKIVYAEHLESAQRNPLMWVQTCPVREGEGHKTKFEQFYRDWKAKPASICFDFQHYLEWTLGPTMTPSNLVGLTQVELAKRLIDGFEMFHPHVKEIHLTDSKPKLGRIGLNVMLGTGVLPLMEVCRHIVERGWRGVVVPEVAPGLWKFTERAKRMLDAAERLFY